VQYPRKHPREHFLHTVKCLAMAVLAVMLILPLDVLTDEPIHLLNCLRTSVCATGFLQLPCTLCFSTYIYTTRNVHWLNIYGTQLLQPMCPTA